MTAAGANDALMAMLNRTGDDVDMSAPPAVERADTVYTGAIFHVEDQWIRLTLKDGGSTVIRRQVMRHAPCVVMLVHDCARDRYLLEREYRVGPNAYVCGLPAGLMDDGEDPRTAALRELREETGVIPGTSDDDAGDDVDIDPVARCYSSEGMTDELANIMVLHLRRWHQGPCRFDHDEHVQSAWVGWKDLNNAGIIASNATIALKHEALRRLQRPEWVEDFARNHKGEAAQGKTAA